MAIGHYIKEIGRGKDGARALSREQAADLFGQVLDGTVSDLELGAFCIAMRIKGETPEEMCGFLDATQKRLTPVAVAPAPAHRPTVVLPSYNGARKLPGLTPLLALLLAREGFAVLIHGTPTESGRIYTGDVLAALDIAPQPPTRTVATGSVAYVPTASLHGGLQRLLEVRRVLNLRNPAHSLVKLLLPCTGAQLLVSNYTHPEYADSMARVLCATRSTALLIRGTEGEPVADARRTPRMTAIARGEVLETVEPQGGSLAQLPELPSCEAQATAGYIRAVLAGDLPTPYPLQAQVAQIIALAGRA